MRRKAFEVEVEGKVSVWWMAGAATDRAARLRAKRAKAVMT